jgi:endonuclease III
MPQLETESSVPAPTPRTLRRVNELLIERYGQRTPAPRDPLDGLILIVLSQATNDINCDRAFRSLKTAFPTWQDVLDAPVDAVADAIRGGGLANQKAARIQQMLRRMKEESGVLDLSWMREATPRSCIEYLEKFHGIGPKTIACVLMFFLNKPAFPVDTHVLRVTKRLGWLRPRASAEEAHHVLGALVPDDCKLDLHVNLISHGRAVCRAQGNGGPRCGECILRRQCRYGKALKAKSPVQDAKRADKFHGGDFFVTLAS